jgi:putative protein kinase ArgK-like GTPase of G3E family
MAGTGSLPESEQSSGGHTHLSQATTQPATQSVLVIVGIYGLPGSGKTFLLNQLKQELGRENVEFYEGSKVIASFVPGGLDRFRNLVERDKVLWR